MIVHWPNGVKGKGDIRSQFHHVIDVAKTILDVTGLPEPTFVNGISQAPLEGVSMAPTFSDPNAPETHNVQYFEMMGNRGIYHEGWTAVTKHRTPWKADAPPPFDDESGSSTAPTIGRSRRTSPPTIRRNWRSCSGSGSSRR